MGFPMFDHYENQVSDGSTALSSFTAEHLYKAKVRTKKRNARFTFFFLQAKLFGFPYLSLPLQDPSLSRLRTVGGG